MQQPLQEMLTIAITFCLHNLWLLVVPALIGFLAAGWSRPKQRRWFHHLPTVVLLVAGLALVVRNTAIFDDAYYSFRCARNLADGYGLVFNPGQYFEIYTNFLWTIWLALCLKLSGMNLEILAVLSNYACWLANMIVVYKIGLALNAKSKHYFPLAVLVLALQYYFMSFGTSGLETMAGSLLVNLGAYFLIMERTYSRSFLAGSFFILAMFNRMDHALFFLCGTAALLWRDRAYWPALVKRDWKRGCTGMFHLLTFLAPLTAYGIYLLWKVHYYGSLFPSAFYTKSAAASYYHQGLIYTLMFYLGSHFYLLLPLLFLWLTAGLRKKSEETPGASVFRLFALAAVTVWHFYVIRVGGDYLIGRFYIVLMPLMILGGEHFIFSQLTNRMAQRILAALVAATAFGVPLLTGMEGAYCQMDGHNHYQKYILTIWENRHNHERTFPCFIERKLSPLVLADAKYGYDSALPIIDRWGITDRQFSRRQVTYRGCPGHEKYVSLQELVDRGIRLSLIPTELFDNRYQEINDLVTPCGTIDLLVYDIDFVDDLREYLSDVSLPDFPAFLDGYLTTLTQKPRPEVAEDLKNFQFYYFNIHPDPARLQPILDYLAEGSSASAVNAAP